jgi:tetratricopeptide (TPR) repeat protein
LAPVSAQDKPGENATEKPKPTDKPQQSSKPTTAGDKMPMSGLAAAKLQLGLCVYSYRITTQSEECQQFFDQGLGYLYSYVWMEAARNFETATLKDPECAMAWWGLSRALERWAKGGDNATKALKKADELKSQVSDREQMLIQARMFERGLVSTANTLDARRKETIASLDKLLALYDDDEEAWVARALAACDGKMFGGTDSSLPFYKALLRINPLHPLANHEMVHYYETAQRPALGWIASENYIKSSPGIPHPYHMQSHLATRLGRWDKSSGSSTRAVEIQREYHRTMHIKPSEDSQYSHHLEILLVSLTHDGRFAEAEKIRKEMESAGYKTYPAWFRYHYARGDWDGARKIAELLRKTDKRASSYYQALLALGVDDLSTAEAEIAILEEEHRSKRADKQLQFRLWETRGALLCRHGVVEEGLKLLKRCVDQTMNDYKHHAWGNGAYYMECWGLEALRGGRLDVAEEAFLEALAHDTGSVRAALGLQAISESQGRSSEASRYAELAERFWKHANPDDFDALRKAVRQKAMAKKG